MHKTFEELFATRKASAPKRLVVACANEDHTLEAVSLAVKEGSVAPILIGNGEDLKTRATAWGLENARIIDAENDQDAVNKAVALIREGEGDILLKGLVDTAVIMRAVVSKENGLCARGVLSHLTLTQIPTYHKLLGVTDCALLTYPTLEQKKAAIINSVEFLAALGIETPKVAVLAASGDFPAKPATASSRAPSLMIWPCAPALPPSRDSIVPWQVIPTFCAFPTSPWATCSSRLSPVLPRPSAPG